MGMESFIRVYKDHGITETAMEIDVLPYSTTSPFSALGDSGSIVLDRNRRIVGMITGGAGSTDGTDITYLTPYWYIEQEIKSLSLTASSTTSSTRWNVSSRPCCLHFIVSLIQILRLLFLTSLPSLV
ncbi:hypothetical protein PIIN_11042 [Serendipita indica DSM 11827]|uniref:Peptidase S1 domain-containing protein n=1 Tax=Serendipita indica (strain DSM 11827) TaxID=1109443 RepID=G4U0G4_SERID|nr:hypothetical protein PIIN_11042 [Serendipita indica DSM 11827]